MGIQTIAQLDARRERDQVMANEAEVQNSFFEKHPELDRQCNWNIIRDGIGNQPVTVANAEQAAGANGSLLAAISPEELQAEQVQMADTICVSQFQRKFKPYERESWSAKLYEMTREKRHRYLVQLPRMEARDLTERERNRPGILAAKRQSRPAFDAAVILGGRTAYDQTIADEMETYASMDIELLETVGAELRAVDAHKNASADELRQEVREDYQARHPEAVGASPVRSFEEARRYNARSQEVENRNSGGQIVIGYTRAELINMPRTEFRDLFQRPNGNGGYEFKPGYAAAVDKVLNGEMTDAARERDQALRNRI